MNWTNRKLLIILSALLLLQAGLIGLWLVKNQSAKLVVAPPVLEQPTNYPQAWSSPPNLDFFDEAYAQAPKFTTQSRVYGGIVPHHLFVKNEIAGFFQALAGEQYERIILIGPNHGGSGKDKIIGSRAWWQTPYGELAPDLEFINQLGYLAGTDETVMKQEFSISGLVPFIKKTWPNIKIVPLIVKVNLPSNQAEELAKTLFDNVDPQKTLVLASVDFSHYLPVAVADWHDEISREAITGFDFAKIKTLEVDSPMSLFILVKYLALAGAEQAELVAHTNSGQLSDQPDAGATSHQFYYFYQGSAKIDRALSWLLVGDIMLDRAVGDIIKRRGLNSLLDKIAGQEKRFFSGIDIISANLEGAVTKAGAHYPPVIENDFAWSSDVVAQFKPYGFNYFAIANNHVTDQGTKGYLETRDNLKNIELNFSGTPDRAVSDDSATILDIGGAKVGMISLSMVYGDFDLKQAKDLITKTKARTNVAVINIHWGQEYQKQFNKHQQAIAHALIDAGADLIIGHHPHVVQGIEVYKNKAIFYSLGNFIFDQYWGQDTQRGLVVGAIYESGKWRFHLFPIDLAKSQPYLLLGEAKTEFLKDLARVSSLTPDFSQEITKGQLFVY